MCRSDRSLFTMAISLLIMLSLFSPILPASGSDTLPRENKKWTFMVYLDADNNLDPWGRGDLDEMKAVGSDSNINIVVLWDGRGSGDGELLYITQGGEDSYPTSDADIPNEPDMSNPDTLQKFLDWAIGDYPADHYLLSIWDHGSGIFTRSGGDGDTKGFCSDDHGGGEMELWELNDVLSAANTKAGKKIDIVGFDVCLLGHMETHYQIMPFVDYGIASEANEPGDGWDYEVPLEALSQNPDMSPAALASKIVTAYLDFYSSGVTQAAVDLRALNETLLPVFDDFAEMLTNYMYHYENRINNARDNAQRAGHSNDRDLYDFAYNIQQDGSLPAVVRNAASALLTELSTVVIEEGQKGYSGAKGMVVYFPTGGPSNTYLNKIDMAATKWDEFLEEYSNPQLRYKMELLVFDEDGDAHEDDVMITISDFVGGQGIGAQVWVDGELIGTTNDQGEIGCLDRSKGIHTVKAVMSGFEMNDMFEVANRPPTAMALVPGSAMANEPVEFNGSLSSDPDGDLLSYIWTFGDGGGSARADPVHVFADDGVFNVTLVVMDTDSIESEPFTFDMTIENLPPVADAGDNAAALEDEILSFDGSGSWDTPIDRTFLLFMWDFGDGASTQWSNISTVNHSYERGGASGAEISYTVELTVKDDNGEISSDHIIVNVSNVIPEAYAGADITVFEDEVFTLGGENSTDSLSDIGSLKYAWDLDDGDGPDYLDGDEINVEHSYNTSGIYMAALRVTDDDGESSTDGVEITVLNMGPTALLPFDEVNVTESEVIPLDGSMCTDTPSDLPGLEYIWEVDNGTSDMGSEVDFSFYRPGTYNITLTAKDDDGETGSATVKVNVRNEPPTAALEPVPDPEEDEEVTLDAGGTLDTPFDLISLEYRWDLDYDGVTFTPGVTTSEPYLTRSFTESGTVKIMLMVVDNDGASDSAEVSFEVLNVEPRAVLNATLDRCVEGETLLFDGRESNDSESDEPGLVFEWRIDDVLVDSVNRTLSYTFERPGHYVLSLTVRDDDGMEDVRKMTVTVDEKKIAGLSMIISPSFSNGGMFLYIALAAVVLIFVVLLVVIKVGKSRKRARGEAEKSKKNVAGGKKSGSGSGSGRELTKEEKQREYEKLYGTSSGASNTVVTASTPSYMNEENPFMEQSGDRDRYDYDDYGGSGYSAVDDGTDEADAGVVFMVENGSDGDATEEGLRRDGKENGDGSPDVASSLGSGSGSGAKATGKKYRNAKEFKDRTARLKEMRQRRKDRRRKTVKKEKLDEIFDFLDYAGSEDPDDGEHDVVENMTKDEVAELGHDTGEVVGVVAGEDPGAVHSTDWDDDDEDSEDDENNVTGIAGWDL